MVCPADEFHLAVFSIGGTLAGVRKWNNADLDATTVRNYQAVLASNGSQFQNGLPSPNDDVQYKFTTHYGAGLLTVSVSGNLAVSGVLVDGSNPEVNDQFLCMFCDSISKSTPVVALGSAGAFRTMLKLTQRPLAVLVVWGNPKITDDRLEVVKEFVWHFTGAFFRPR